MIKAMSKKFEVKIEFKSDRCGIEIPLQDDYSQVHALFKSDRCGIEMMILPANGGYFCEFKSDRCGIEILYRFILYLSCYLVQIRPLRDWNSIRCIDDLF